jgi:hypothetical protein
MKVKKHMQQDFGMYSNKNSCIINTGWVGFAMFWGNLCFKKIYSLWGLTTSSNGPGCFIDILVFFGGFSWEIQGLGPLI